MRHNADRRKFLGGLGALGATSFLGTPAVLAQSALGGRFVVREDRFGRMFPGLPSFAQPGPALSAALTDIGKLGGIMDANDNLAAGPVALIVDPALNVNNPNNPAHTAGTTFFGQFLDHDVTFDLTSRLNEPLDPEDAPNTRTPALDLDSVYGGGPRRSPELYGFQGSRIKFKVESGGQFEDLPRNAQGIAIIGDPRNDENIIISGLQVAFLKFHNNAVDHVRARNRRADDDEVFRDARRLTTWHYHWLILHEFLPQILGQGMVDSILRRGRRFYTPRVAFMPVEFQGAAYRFGHSMVRPSYRANLAGHNGAPFFAMIFDPAGQSQADPVDLRGGARAPRRFIGWQTFFDFGPAFTDGPGNLNPAIRPNKLIDTRISSPLFQLPLQTIADGAPPISLPTRNLLRHVTWSLPSGQRVAREMDVEPLSRGDLGELAGYGVNLDRSTPLWYYILKEAFVRTGGATLGPVGGRIVGEVFVGLLEHDDDSYVRRDPLWRPTLPQFGSGRVTGRFRMVDFLAFAGVDPATRKQ